MEHDALKSECRRAVAVISHKCYRPGMTTADVKRANGLVLVGEIPDEAMELLRNLASQHNHRVEIVVVEPGFPQEEMLSNAEANKFDIIFTQHMEMKAVKESVRSPPWAGKRPWWQR